MACLGRLVVTVILIVYACPTLLTMMVQFARGGSRTGDAGRLQIDGFQNDGFYSEMITAEELDRHRRRIHDPCNRTVIGVKPDFSNRSTYEPDNITCDGLEAYPDGYPIKCPCNKTKECAHSDTRICDTYNNRCKSLMGERCSSSFDCKFLQFCGWKYNCTDPWICRMLQSRPGCRRDDDCYGMLICDSDTRCRVGCTYQADCTGRPMGRGSRCSKRDGTIRACRWKLLASGKCHVDLDCEDFTTCDVDRICRLRPGYGCIKDEQCVSESMCTRRLSSDPLMCRIIVGSNRTCLYGDSMFCVGEAICDKNKHCRRDLHEPCTNASECRDDTICTSRLGDYLKKCRRVATQPCSTDKDCERSTVCENGKCKKYKDVSCTTASECRDNMNCTSRYYYPEKKCRRAVNQPCLFYTDCEETASCDPSTQICKTNPGMPCSNTSQCPPNVTCETLFNSTDKQCRSEIGTKGCLSDETCVEGAYCQMKGTNKRVKRECVGRPGLGEPCSKYGSCQRGMECSLHRNSSNVVVGSTACRKPQGSKGCKKHEDCAGFAFCSDDRICTDGELNPINNKQRSGKSVGGMSFALASSVVGSLLLVIILAGVVVAVSRTRPEHRSEHSLRMSQIPGEGVFPGAVGEVSHGSTVISSGFPGPAPFQVGGSSVSHGGWEGDSAGGSELESQSSVGDNESDFSSVYSHSHGHYM